MDGSKRPSADSRRSKRPLAASISDGDVDLADYAIWHDAFGVNNFGDATGDGISDAADYTVWRDQLGSVLPPVVMASAAPEPATMLLLLCALPLEILRRRRPR